MEIFIKDEHTRNIEFLSDAYVSKKLYEKYCYEADKSYGLSICEGEVLLHIHFRGGESAAKDIVEKKWISKSQVSKAVERLVRLGYIAEATDQSDRRITRLRLTEAAEAPVRELEKATQDFMDKLFEGLTDEEIGEVNRLFQKMTENIRGERQQ